jgi:hypothetical protein
LGALPALVCTMTLGWFAAPAIAGSATSAGGDTLTWNVRLSSRLPHHGVGLSELRGSYTNNQGLKPRAPLITFFRFPRGFKINDRYFPRCSLTAARCPAATQIGEGRFVVDGRPSFPIVSAVFREFLGERNGNGDPMEFDEITIGTALIKEKLPFTVKRDGPFGLMETLDFGKQFGYPPPGVATHFTVAEPDRSTIARIHGRRTRVHLYETPSTCTGSWSYAIEDAYPDGPPLRAVAKVPCRQH